MTLGRPAIVPENHVRLDLPRSFKDVRSLPSDSALNDNAADDSESVKFFAVTMCVTSDHPSFDLN
jgi:hypothetical protein